MSHAPKLLKFGYLTRGTSILTMRKILNLPISLMPNLVPTPIQTQTKLTMTTPPMPPSEEPKSPEDIPERSDYTVRFKKTDIKKIFKEFYSLYGPLFVVCHITIALCSLGFFSAIVWLTIDPVQYLPDVLATSIGENMIGMTGNGGKFAIAYAVHKLILPFRLGTAIWMTRSIASRFKLKRGPSTTGQSNN